MMAGALERLWRLRRLRPPQQKGRETTELLTVCLCMDKPTNLFWQYLFVLRCNVTGHLDLELGPQAKGSQWGPCKSSEKPKVAKGTSWKP